MSLKERELEEKTLARVDPKKAYLNLLIIGQMKKIQDALYGSNPLLAVRLMRGLIDSLPQKAQHDLNEITEELRQIERDPRVPRLHLEDLNRKISSYLLNGILKDVSGYSGVDPNKEAETL